MNAQQQHDLSNALALLSKIANSAIQPEPVSTGSSFSKFDTMLAARRKKLLTKKPSTTCAK